MSLKRIAYLIIVTTVFISACKQNILRKTNADNALGDSLLLSAIRNSFIDTDIAMDEAQLAISFFTQSNDSNKLAKCYLTIGRIEADRGRSNEAIKYFKMVDEWLDPSKANEISANNALETGKIYYDWGQYDSSLLFSIKAHEAAILLHDTMLLAHSNYQIGKYYHTTGRFDQSMEYYKNSLQMVNGCIDKSLKVNILLSIGKNYLNRSNTAEALANYQKAYLQSNDISDKLAKADACNHLGSIYLHLMKPQLSIEYHREALHLRSAMKNNNGMAKSHNNIGETFMAIGMTDSALYHFKRALEVSSYINYHKGMVKALNNLAAIHSIKNEMDNAFNDLNQALQLCISSGYQEGVAEAYYIKGQLYQKTNKGHEALQFFNQALTIAANVNRNDLMVRCNRGIYLTLKQLSKHQEALIALEKASAMELTELETEKNRQIAEMHILFESDKKERENEMLKKQNDLHAINISRKNKLLLVSLLSVVFLLIIMLMIYFRSQNNKKANLAMKAMNKQLESAVTERDKLLSIIAHELRNPLFWFQNLTQTLSQKFRIMPPEKIQKSLLSLDESAKNAFHLMDNLLNWSRSRLNRITPKASEIKLKALIDQNIRLFDSIIDYKQIKLVIYCPEETIVYADNDLLDTVCRNLLSNAIKYSPECGIIRIDCIPQMHFVNISISDSGKGISNDMKTSFINNEHLNSYQGLMQEKGSGFGLKLCKEFTELIGGEIGINESHLGGACFWFTVPVKVS